MKLSEYLSLPTVSDQVDAIDNHGRELLAAIAVSVDYLPALDSKEMAMCGLMSIVIENLAATKANSTSIFVVDVMTIAMLLYKIAGMDLSAFAEHADRAHLDNPISIRSTIDFLTERLAEE